MRRLSIILFYFIVVFDSITPIFAQTTYQGGKGLLRVLDAGSLRPGMFYANTFVLTFLKSKDEGVLIKDHTMTIGLTLGLVQNLELTGQLTPYQDDQTQWGKPANISLGLKLRFAGSKSSDYGLAGAVIIPTVIDGPVAYEPYISGEYGWQLRLLAAYDMRHILPSLPMKFHFNVGFYDTNFKDTYFTEREDQLLLGAAVKFPVRSALLYTEYTAEVFMNEPSVAFAENSMRITQGVRFLGPWNLVMDLAFDVGLHKARNSKAEFMKTYANWKFNLGLSYQSRLYRPMTRDEKRREKIRQLEENKLDQIRKEREQATQELEKMKKQLEEEKRKEKDPDGEPDSN